MDTIKQHALKIQIGTAVAVIMFIIGSVWWFSNELGEMKHRIESNAKDISTIYEMAKDNSRNGVEIKVKLSAIEAQLSGITATLVEIKKSVQ